MEITKAQAQSGAISQKRLKAKPALIDVELFVQPTGIEQIAFDPRLSAEHEGQHHQIECRRVAFQNKIEYAAEIPDHENLGVVQTHLTAAKAPNLFGELVFNLVPAFTVVGQGQFSFLIRLVHQLPREVLHD